MAIEEAQQEPRLSQGRLWHGGDTVKITPTEESILRPYVMNFGFFVTADDLRKSLKGKSWETPVVKNATNARHKLRGRLSLLGLEFESRGRSDHALKRSGTMAALRLPEKTIAPPPIPKPAEVKAWREALGWSRAKAASVLGISPSWLTAVENGQRNVKGKPAKPSSVMAMAMQFITENAK